MEYHGLVRLLLYTMKASLLNPSTGRLKEAICDARIYQTKYLLESGVDVSFIDEEGLTPLMRAAQIPDEKSRTRHNLLKLLLQYGANVNTVDPKGRHVLSRACMDEKEDIVRLLCGVAKQDVDLNLQDFEGNTPLMHSVRTGNAGLVKFLLDELKEFQVDIDVRNSEDRTPYLEAKRLGYEDCAQILLTGGNASTKIQVNPFLDFISVKDESSLKGRVRGLEESKDAINSSAETRHVNPRSLLKKKSVPLRKTVHMTAEKSAFGSEKMLKRKSSSPRKITSLKAEKEETKVLGNLPRRRKYAWNELVIAHEQASRNSEIEREFKLATQPAEAASTPDLVANCPSQTKTSRYVTQERPSSSKHEAPLARSNDRSFNQECTRAERQERFERESPKITTDLRPLIGRKFKSDPLITSRRPLRSYSVTKHTEEDALDDNYSWYSHFSVYNSSSVAFLTKIMNLYAEQMSPDSSFRSGVKPVNSDEPKVPKISVVAVPGDDLRSDSGRLSPVRSAMSSRSNSANSVTSNRKFQSAVSRTVTPYLTSKRSLSTLRVQDVDF